MENQDKANIGASYSGSTASSGSQPSSSHEPRNKAGEQIAHSLKEAGAKTEDETKTQVKSVLHEQKNRAADQIDSFADALRRTSRDIRSQDENQMIAEYADAAAGQVERLSNYLKSRDVGQLVESLRSTAQRQPEVFAAGALAAGFLVGRFLKSSSPSSRDRMRSTGSAYQNRYSTGCRSSRDGQSFSEPAQRVPVSHADERKPGWEQSYGR